MVPDAAAARPRVEGDREQEILDATLDGARRRRLRPAHHGRRRHRGQGLARPRSTAAGTTKVSLVIDAAAAQPRRPARSPTPAPCAATCSRSFCGMGGLGRRSAVATCSASVITAHRPRRGVRRGVPRATFIGPKIARLAAIFERARDRGEIRADVDLDLLAPALAGIVLHRAFVLGEPPDRRARSPA